MAQSTQQAVNVKDFADGSLDIRGFVSVGKSRQPPDRSWSSCCSGPSIL